MTDKCASLKLSPGNVHRWEWMATSAANDAAAQALHQQITRFAQVSLKALRCVHVLKCSAQGLQKLGLSRELDDSKWGECLEHVGKQLFIDPVQHSLHRDGQILATTSNQFNWYVEVSFLAGVTDNVGRTAQEVLEAFLDCPPNAPLYVHSTKGFLIAAELDETAIKTLSTQWLGNTLVNRVDVLPLTAGQSLANSSQNTALFVVPSPAQATGTDSKVHGYGTQPEGDKQLPAFYQMVEQHQLGLSMAECEAISTHYQKPSVLATRQQAGLGADITDIELEILAQTWSEHCKHKIFNATIDYAGSEDAAPEKIHSLFNTYIKGSTEKVRAALGDSDPCLSVFHDNAGVVVFDEHHSLALKVETHNTPSALEPYGGALTGILGVNRDPFGTGRGGELIFNTNVFCFASPFHTAPLPEGILHPGRIYEGVRSGVQDGGNKSGIPTVNGSLTFDDRFLGKPLVFCGSGAMLPSMLHGRPTHEKWIEDGDHIVMVGGRVGRDGIHGATASSQAIQPDTPAGIVQIGDPITQKKMWDFLLLARDQGLYHAITDNGAGGLSSSVGELAQLCGGADLWIDRVPLKYEGLAPWEVVVSESQERMTLAVPPKYLSQLLVLGKKMGVECSDIGHFHTKPWFKLLRGEEEVLGLLEMDFLHEGLPTMQLQAQARTVSLKPQPTLPEGNVTEWLAKVLGCLNVCSKERIVRRYDHEVGGGSVIKPMVGISHDGPSDAAVMRPLLNSMRGIAIAHGLCPRYGDVDAAQMAMLAVDEAMRNLVAVGADPSKVVGLDNFCWSDPLPSPNNPAAPHTLAQLVEANKALYDIVVAYGIPLISGKDSMKNDYRGKDANGQPLRISIPPTLLFTAIAVVDDVRQAITMDVKAPGDKVYLVGETRNALACSELFGVLEIDPHTGHLPQLADLAAQQQCYQRIHQATQKGWIRSAHDCSDGGLAVSLAESAFAGGFGMQITLPPTPSENLSADEQALSPTQWLFSESPGRLVLTVSPDHAADFEQHMQGLPWHLLGEVQSSPRLQITANKQVYVDEQLDTLKAHWQAPLAHL